MEKQIKVFDVIAIVLFVTASVFSLLLKKKSKIVETNIFDKEEVFEDCTVQVLTNTVTGETSVGWWKNSDPPESMEDKT